MLIVKIQIAMFVMSGLVENVLVKRKSPVRNVLDKKELNVMFQDVIMERLSVEVSQVLV
jgi:hypothetical protein